jgi:hypothetical protein
MQKLLLKQEEFSSIFDEFTGKIALCIEKQRPYRKYVENFFNSVCNRDNSLILLSEVDFGDSELDTPPASDPLQDTEKTKQIELQKLKNILEKSADYFWKQLTSRKAFADKKQAATNYWVLINRLVKAFYNTVKNKIGAKKFTGLNSVEDPLNIIPRGLESDADVLANQLGGKIKDIDQRNEFFKWVVQTKKNNKISNQLVKRYLHDKQIKLESIKNTALLDGFRLMMEGKIDSEWYVRNIESCIKFYDLPFEESVQYANDFANSKLLKEEKLDNVFASDARNSNLIGIAKKFSYDIQKSNLAKPIKDYVKNNILAKIEADPDKIYKLLFPDESIFKKDQTEFAIHKHNHAVNIFNKLLDDAGFSQEEVSEAVFSLMRNKRIPKGFEQKFAEIDKNILRQAKSVAKDIGLLPSDEDEQPSDDEDEQPSDENSKLNPVAKIRKLMTTKVGKISMAVLSAGVIGLMLFKMFGGPSGQPSRVDPSKEVASAMVQVMNDAGGTGPVPPDSSNNKIGAKDLPLKPAPETKAKDLPLKPAPETNTSAPSQAPTEPVQEPSVEDLVKNKAFLNKPGYLGQMNLTVYQDDKGGHWVKDNIGNKLGKLVPNKELVDKVNKAAKVGIKFDAKSYSFQQYKDGKPVGAKKVADHLLNTDIQKALSKGLTEKDLTAKTATTAPETKAPNSPLKPAPETKALDAQELGSLSYSDINKIQLTSDNPATEIEEIFKSKANGNSSQMTKIAKSIFQKENSSDGAKIADKNVVKFLLNKNSMPKTLAIDLLADSDNLDPEDVQKLATVIDANKIKNNTQRDRSYSLVNFLTMDAEQKADSPTPKVFNAAKTYIKVVGGVKNLSKAEISYLANNNFIDQPTAEEIRNVHDLSGNTDLQSKINQMSGFSQGVSDNLDAAGKFVKDKSKEAANLIKTGLEKANEKSAQVNDFLNNIEKLASQGRTTSLFTSGEMEKSLADLAKNRVNSLSTDAVSQDDARDLKAGALYKYAKTVSDKPNSADEETTDLMQKYVKAVDNKVGPSPDSAIKQVGDMVGAGAKSGMDFAQGQWAIEGDLKKISSGNYEKMSTQVAKEFQKQVDKLSVTKISDNRAEELQRGNMYKLAKSIVSAAESSDDGSADSGIPNEKMGNSTELNTNSDSYKLAKSYIDKIDSSSGQGKFLKAGLNWLDNTKEKLAQDAKYQVPETPTPLIGGDSSNAPNSIIGKVLTDKGNFNPDELKQVLSDDPAWTGAILLRTPDKAATTEKIIKAYGIANVPQDIIKYLAGFGDVGPGTAVKLLDGGTGVYDDETKGLLLTSIQSLKPATDQESAETINKIKQGNIPSEAEIAKAGSAGQLGNLLKSADQTKKAEMTQKVIDSYGGTKNIGNIVAKYLATDGSLSPEQAKQLLDTGNRISNMDKVSADNKYDAQTMKMLQNIANQQQNESVNFVNFKTFMEDFKFITLKKPKVCVFNFC